MLFQSEVVVVVEGTRGNDRGKLGEKNKTLHCPHSLKQVFYFISALTMRLWEGKKTTAVACLKTLHGLKDITSTKTCCGKCAFWFLTRLFRVISTLCSRLVPWIQW